MLVRQLPSSTKDLSVVRKAVPVVLAESGGSALALILPPLEEIDEINELRPRLYSLRDMSLASVQALQRQFRWEFENIKKIEPRFSGSATYFNRVANLAVMAGDYEEEAVNLERARKLSPDVFFVHRLADNFISRNKTREAESLITNLDLDHDLYANLRLAFFYVQHNELKHAEARVEQALRIDPLDFGARLFDGGLLLVSGSSERAIQSFKIAAETRETATLHTNLALAYFRLNLIDKSLSSLRKAVALDPLHLNAIVLLADLAFRERRNEDALPSLRYFVQFEQKHPEIWSRLARACFHIGMVDETIAALKRQATLEDSTSVWNNLGVCYQVKRYREKADQAFVHALRLGESGRGREYFWAARSVAHSLASKHNWKELLDFSTAVLAKDRNELCLRDDVLSDLYAFQVTALNVLRHHEEARTLSEQLLVEPASNRLKTWLVSNLVTYYALYGHSDRFAQLIREYEAMVEDRSQMADIERRMFFFNNAAFAFAEAGSLDVAQRYLSKISESIHRQAYPTATLGLIHFRRGHIDRGKSLYREAIGLAATDMDKDRIRQKLHLELGRYWLQKRPAEARRNLQRVMEIKLGEAALADAAKQLLDSLSSEK